VGVEIIKPLLATPIGRRNGRRIWKLMADYVLKIDGREITVPEGFETDYASVPRTPLLNLVFGDSAHEAAVPHDFGYRYDAGNIDKSVVDKWFLEIMNHLNEPPERWKRQLMYLAVCYFANSSWHKMSTKDSLCKE
jgi:hypothetical protein